MLLNCIAFDLYLLNLIFMRRTPNLDAVVVVHTASGVFSARSLLQNQKGCFKGSRLVSSKRIEVQESSTLETNEFEPDSAARCRIFKRSSHKVYMKVHLSCFGSIPFLFSLYFNREFSYSFSY